MNKLLWYSLGPQKPWKCFEIEGLKKNWGIPIISTCMERPGRIEGDLTKDKRILVVKVDILETRSQKWSWAQKYFESSKTIPEGPLICSEGLRGPWGTNKNLTRFKCSESADGDIAETQMALNLKTILKMKWSFQPLKRLPGSLKEHW